MTLSLNSVSKRFTAETLNTIQAGNKAAHVPSDTFSGEVARFPKMASSSVARSPFSLFTGAVERSERTSFEYPDSNGGTVILEKEVSIIPSPSSAVRERAITSLLTIGPALSGDIATIQNIIPSVVRMNVENDKGEEWYGSGVIVEPSDIIPGYQASYGEYFILTNNHVAEDAKYMSAMLPNGHEIHAETVESQYHTKLLDKGMDIALVRINVPFPLPTAKIGNPDELLPGQTIFTAGYPRALPKISITKGIISNPAQETGSLSLDIQSDAPINPGNSGGPSFNEAGEIVGLNTYTFRGGEDLTFTKPIDQQIAMLRRLWDDGIVIRGDLGFKVEDLSLNEREKIGFPEGTTGARIVQVPAGSMVERAGLKVGDIITWMEVRRNGEAIKTLEVDIKDGFEANGVIKRWAADIFPGTVVNMIVWRKEGSKYSTFDIPVTTGMLSDLD